jgi:uncharacterized protein YcaQ
VSLAKLRRHAVALPPLASLPVVLDRLGFVQADPIRAPARAQDLILRQRALGYRAGQLEAEYPSLAVEEDLLYAYGFLSRPAWRLLHPRKPRPPGRFEARVLARVREAGPTHPRDLEAELGGGRVTNAWGGTSRATTAALDRLHMAGLLRVARREHGQRVYAAVSRDDDAHVETRVPELVRLVAAILAPVPLPTLSAVAAYLMRHQPRVKAPRGVIAGLIASGALEHEVVEGLAYVWPAGSRRGDEAERRVRLLAPFDPVVWDRRRFEQLWGWAYRFEAYTPVAKRVRGYYALPLLYGEQVIGWANVTRTPDGLDVDTGFVGKKPRGPDFRRELDAEIARLEVFLAGPDRAP